MALNWTMLSPDRAPIPLPDELIIQKIGPGGAEITVLIPHVPPTGVATSGGSGGLKKLKETGQLFLTDQRLIFISDTTAGKPTFESLSISLTLILSTKFEQPFLGANFLSIDVKPAPSGGLTEGTRTEIRLKDKGIFEFISALEKTRERAIYMKRQQADDDDDGLPTYASPSSSEPATSFASALTPRGNAPSDLPPAYE